MKITQTRVKQYNSTYKIVIAVDGVPVCITQSNKRAKQIEQIAEEIDKICIIANWEDAVAKYKI